MRAVTNAPPVYCEVHGAFLEDCWLEPQDDPMVWDNCMWYYEAN